MSTNSIGCRRTLKLSLVRWPSASKRLWLKTGDGQGELQAIGVAHTPPVHGIHRAAELEKAYPPSAQAKLAPPDLLGLRLLEWVPCWILSVRLSPVSSRSIQ